MKIYCDASFDEKRGLAGLGLVICKGSKQQIISNYIPAPDNNYAELWAIYLASILSHGKATIYTDSQTALQYIQGEVKEKPRTAEQLTRHRRMQLLAYKVRRLGATVCKIKGHEKKFQTHLINNNLSDMAAKQGRAKFYERTE